MSKVKSVGVKLMHLSGARRSSRQVLALFGLVGIVTLAAACGSSSSASSSTTTTVAGTGTQSAALAKFTSCLESKGVPTSAATSLFGGRFRGGAGGAGGPGGSIPSGSFPSGSAPSGGFTRQTIPSQYQSAFAACRSLLPFGRGGGGGFNSAAFATYRNCLVANGVVIPTTTTVAGSTPSTPGFGGGGGGLQGLSSQPAYAAAAAKCASLRPSFGGAPTTTAPAA